jgi:hypothetical protein
MADEEMKAEPERLRAETNVSRLQKRKESKACVYRVKLIISGHAISDLSLEIHAYSVNAAAQKAHSIWMSLGRLPPFGTRYSIHVHGMTGLRLREFERTNGAAQIHPDPKGE